MHIASANLEHIGVARHQFDLAYVHDFGDHGQAMFVADLMQHLQTALTQPLEAIRAGAWLERPTAQEVSPRSLDGNGDRFQNLGVFNGTRPSNHGQAPATNANWLDAWPRVGTDDDLGVVPMNSRLASLKGLRMGKTCSTPGIAARGSTCSLSSSPMTPTMVRNSPRLR